MSVALLNALIARPPRTDEALDLIEAGHRLTTNELANLPNETVGLYLSLVNFHELTEATKHWAKAAREARTTEERAAAEEQRKRFKEFRAKQFSKLIEHIKLRREERARTQELENERSSPGLSR